MAPLKRSALCARAVRRIESEYGETLARVIAGYYRDGESQRSVSRILGLSLRHVRAVTIEEGLDPPRRPVTLQARTSAHRKHIAGTMRRRHGRRVRHRGKTRSLSEWAELTGIDLHTLRMRLNRGWSVSRALSEPKKTKGKIGGVFEGKPTSRPLPTPETNHLLVNMPEDPTHEESASFFDHECLRKSYEPRR